MVVFHSISISLLSELFSHVLTLVYPIINHGTGSWSLWFEILEDPSLILYPVYKLFSYYSLPRMALH